MTEQTVTGSEPSARILTSEDVAAWMRVSPRTVHRLAEDGCIPCFWPAKRTVRFDRDEVQAWMKSGGLARAARQAEAE